MNKINHIGLYVSNLDAAKLFFETYFGATAGAMYQNPRKHFSSYMLEMGGGARLELMTREGINGCKALGNCHISMSVGSKEAVDEVTARLTADGYKLMDGPRTTGDGYYESCIEGIDGNLIEITI